MSRRPSMARFSSGIAIAITLEEWPAFILCFFASHHSASVSKCCQRVLATPRRSPISLKFKAHDGKKDAEAGGAGVGK